MFAPVYVITPAITKSLMEIEASRQAVIDLPIDAALIASLRETARLATAHYTTQLEGNRLTLAQVGETLAGNHLPGQERDQAEVRHHYRALEHIEELAREPRELTEDDLQRIHRLAMEGRASRSPYRDGRNVIRASASCQIVYQPPEAHDIPGLVTDLVGWVNRELASRELPAPIVAATAHYQYTTINPHHDGNGRAARLLTTLILHRAGYGLKGIYSLEEQYARDLRGYYDALAVGPSHNYYRGRAEAAITGFVEYFCRNMADALAAVRAQATRAVARDARGRSPLLRQLEASAVPAARALPLPGRRRRR